MSHHLGRVVSDLSHSSSCGARGQGLRHQSTTTTSNADGGGNHVGNKAKQKLALLFSGVVAWTRSESSAAAEAGCSREKNQRKQQTARDATGARRRGLDIVVAVRKYVSMVEQLFASSYSSGSSSRDGDVRRRGRAHTLTYGRRGVSAASSKRPHMGRLSSAPASLRESPANSGHLSAGDSVTKTSSTPSEVSTMEELQSAIQAAIAHCKNSGVATSQSAAGCGGGDKKQEEERKC